MSAQKSKYYVVWKGVRPGVYTTWADASRQVQGFAGAIFKSFATRGEAEAAFHGATPVYRLTAKSGASSAGIKKIASGDFNQDGMAVDAACSGVPGPMEYRGVWIRSGEQLFHCGPLEDGTNNVGEFLAIVHAADWLKREGRSDTIIYSDSVNAIHWVAAKVCRTKLERTSENEEIFERIAWALRWLKENRLDNPIQKWETQQWGENPADFGRK